MKFNKYGPLADGPNALPFSPLGPFLSSTLVLTCRLTHTCFTFLYLAAVKVSCLWTVITPSVSTHTKR